MAALGPLDDWNNPGRSWGDLLFLSRISDGDGKDVGGMDLGGVQWSKWFFAREVGALDFSMVALGGLAEESGGDHEAFILGTDMAGDGIVVILGLNAGCSAKVGSVWNAVCGGWFVAIFVGREGCESSDVSCVFLVVLDSNPGAGRVDGQLVPTDYGEGDRFGGRVVWV